MADRLESASRARSSRFCVSAAASLGLELGCLLLELARLDLDALASGGHLGHAPPQLLEVLDLLCVRVVEDVTWVLGPVHEIVQLRSHDGGEPLEHVHEDLRRHPASPAGCDT